MTVKTIDTKIVTLTMRAAFAKNSTRGDLAKGLLAALEAAPEIVDVSAAELMSDIMESNLGAFTPPDITNLKAATRGIFTTGDGLPEGSVWKHSNGALYTVVCMANIDTLRPDNYPVTVVYRGENGSIWSRPLDSWYRSMTEHSEPGRDTGTLGWLRK